MISQRFDPRTWHRSWQLDAGARCLLGAADTVVPAESVTVQDDALVIGLADGRTVTVPLSWYPRLSHATAEEHAHWRLIGRGEGIHWPDLDEDISVEGLIAGRPSAESQTCLRKWLASRSADRQ